MLPDRKKKAKVIPIRFAFSQLMDVRQTRCCNGIDASTGYNMSNVIAPLACTLVPARYFFSNDG